VRQEGSVSVLAALKKGGGQHKPAAVETYYWLADRPSHNPTFCEKASFWTQD
jgi:hypothetical protein